MKRKMSSRWSMAGGALVAVSLCTAFGGGAANPEGETPKPAVESAKAVTAPVVDKATLQKQREQEQAQKHLDGLKKEIAECEKQIQSINDAVASGKAKDQQLYFDKKIGFLKSVLDLLQQSQKALEAQDINQAKALRDQMKVLRVDWETTGDMAAKLEMEKLTINSKYGADTSPEIKAAVEQYLQNGEAILAKTKEIRDLQLKQNELRKKMELSYQAIQKQKQVEAKQQKLQEQKKEVPVPAEKKP